jgi:Family of unknown function (DUF5662)
MMPSRLKRAARNVVPTLRYMRLTLLHKAYVMQSGWALGVPLWRLLIHDWSKFTPSEAPHYGRQFFGDKDDPLGFSKAWLHHQHCNPHHFEHWVPVSGHNRGGYADLEPLPMPRWAAREMVADWLAASRAYEGAWPQSFRQWPWFIANWSKITKRMHETTIGHAERALREWFEVEGIVWCLACFDDGCARTDGKPDITKNCPVCGELDQRKQDSQSEQSREPEPLALRQHTSHPVTILGRHTEIGG